MDQRQAAALRIMAAGGNTLSSTMRSRQELLQFKQWKKGTKKKNYFEKTKTKPNYEIFLNNNKAIAFLKRAPRPMGVSKGREKSSFMFPLAQGCCSWAQAPLEQWDFSRKRNARKGPEKHISSPRGLWRCREPGPSPEPL